MSFASRWGKLLPASYKNVEAPVSTAKATAEFDAEFEAFCAEQKRIKAEREAAKIDSTATPQAITEDIGGIPTEEVLEDKPIDLVAEEAYQAFVEEVEDKPKSKRKKKTEEVVESSEEEISF